MALSENVLLGNGTPGPYNFTFKWLEETDIYVMVDSVEQTVNVDYTLQNLNYTTKEGGEILFTASIPNTSEIRIYRDTDVSGTKTQFYPGSAIRAEDLNNNFSQTRYSIQEWREQRVPFYNAVFPDDVDMGGNTILNVKEPTNAQDAATKNYVDTTTWNVTTETLDSSETWVANNSYIATTQAIENRVTTKIDDAITNDIAGSDGITVTDDGDGTITLGLADDSIDFDKIKGVDIITEAEQDAGSPAPADTNIFTGLASSKRFDTIVSNSTPVGSDWEVGKTWLQPVPDNTLSIWNGSGWIGVASGGTFLSQPTVIYVDATNGNDSFDGHRIINPKKTIKNAVASANAGDIILVTPGVYQESLPIDITVSNLSIVGQSIRSCFIHPTSATETETMFRCNSGTYITGFTFAGLKASGTRGGHPVDNDPTYGLPTNQGWVASFYPSCIVKKSPYIQNCTNFADSGIDNDNFDPNNFAGTGGDLTSAPTGGGIFVDGSIVSASSPLRSIVVDSFTQICLDGPGCLVANNGYAQLVSFFGTFCHYHTKALSGGQVNLTNSTTDFGRYGLIADGKSTSPIFTATANGAATAGDITFAINQPTDLWFGSATRPLDNMVVVIGSDLYPILSSSPNGLGWNVTISNPNPSNRSENLGLTNGHSNGAAISFYLRSLISSGGHTFEYAGSGTDYTALPENGGVADEARQTINRNDGVVWQSSTDQNGKFKVGDTFTVDQKTGFVSIDPLSISINVVSDLTPQLGGDLDVLDRRITTTLSNGDIDLDANGSGLIKVTEYNLSQVPIVTQHDIGSGADEISLNGMLGTMAFQDADAFTGTFTGSITAGTAALPSLSISGDTNTGIYSPGADQLALSTNGGERLRITADGKVGINTLTPTAVAHIYGTQNADQFWDAGATVRAYAQASTINNRFIFGTSTNHDVSFITNGSESARIDSSGRLLLGTSTARTNLRSGLATVKTQFETNAANDAFVFLQNAAAPNPAYLVLAKQKSGSTGGNTAVANNDGIGAIEFQGNDGTNFLRAASIFCGADGTPGTNSMPGSLVFSTTANGALSPTERMRITSDGYTRLAAGAGGIQFNGDTAAANALDDYEEGTWTPTLGGTATYTFQDGTYTKIGNVVTARFRIGVNTLGTGSNSQISGLPFSSAGVGTGHIGYFTNIATSLSFIAIYIDPLAPTIASLYNATGPATGLILNPVFQNNTLVMGTVVYRST